MMTVRAMYLSGSPSVCLSVCLFVCQKLYSISLTAGQTEIHGFNDWSDNALMCHSQVSNSVPEGCLV